MEKSLFIEYIQKWFKPIVKQLAEKINGKEGERKYLFSEWLTKEETIDLTWSSEQLSSSIVAADVVAMDSELPLKRRDSFGIASGKIPKLGMKLSLNEKQMKELSVMVRSGSSEDSIVRKLFADTKKALYGVYETAEGLLLSGLSTGAALVNDPENPKMGVRLDYGVKNNHKASVLWSDAANAMPLDDIEKILAAANEKGVTIRHILLNRKTLNEIRKATSVKEAYAGYLGIGYTNATKLPTPNLNGLNDMLEADKGVQLVVIDKSIVREVNGKRTSTSAWTDDRVTFLPTLNVGRLVHSASVEEDRPVEGVAYQKSDFVLLSKYRKNDPVREFTASQAFAVPVLDVAGEMHILDTATV